MWLVACQYFVVSVLIVERYLKLLRWLKREDLPILCVWIEICFRIIIKFFLPMFYSFFPPILPYVAWVFLLDHILALAPTICILHVPFPKILKSCHFLSRIQIRARTCIVQPRFLLSKIVNVNCGERRWLEKLGTLVSLFTWRWREKMGTLGLLNQ